MPPTDPSSEHDKAVSQHEQSFVDLIKAGEAMKAKIAELQGQLALLNAVIDLGCSGKTSTADITLAAFKAAVTAKIVKHLHAAEIKEAIVVCETFAEESDEQIPEFERKSYDSAVHAPGLAVYNGRSLDSHNPWHLEQSFESYLEAEIMGDAYRRREEPETESEDREQRKHNGDYVFTNDAPLLAAVRRKVGTTSIPSQSTSKRFAIIEGGQRTAAAPLAQ